MAVYLGQGDLVLLCLRDRACVNASVLPTSSTDRLITLQLAIGKERHSPRQISNYMILSMMLAFALLVPGTTIPASVLSKAKLKALG